MLKNYTQQYFIKATPEEVYTALTNPFTIELWTGYPAEMQEKEGTEFSLWEGDIVGKNLKFERNKKIVQEWYFGDQEESSIVTILLFKTKKGTRVKLVHENIPEVAYENMKMGWNDYYFGNLKRFFDI
jgi:activator of HSP90 ATPase